MLQTEYSLFERDIRLLQQMHGPLLSRVADGGWQIGWLIWAIGGLLWLACLAATPRFTEAPKSIRPSDEPLTQPSLRDTVFACLFLGWS